MQYVKTIHILTKVYNEFDVITPQVEAIVAESEKRHGDSADQAHHHRRHGE